MRESPSSGDEPIRFEPARPQSPADVVLSDLRRAIVNGKLRPDEHLVETDLASQFHVSRAMIRQAFQELIVSWSALNSLHGALISSRVGIHHYEPAVFSGLHLEICEVLERGDPDEAERVIRLHYMGTVWKDREDREG